MPTEGGTCGLTNRGVERGWAPSPTAPHGGEDVGSGRGPEPPPSLVPCRGQRQRPSTILVLSVPRASPGDAGGLAGSGTFFCPVRPQNGAQGPGEPPHIPKPKVSGLAAEPLEGVAESGAGGGPGEGVASIRNAAAPNVMSRGAAAPQRGRLSPGAGVVLGCRSGLGRRQGDKALGGGGGITPKSCQPPPHTLTPRRVGCGTHRLWGAEGVGLGGGGMSTGKGRILPGAVPGPRGPADGGD